MKTDYITNSTTLPPSLAFPRSLLAADVRFTAKEVYVILLDMALHSEADIHTDEQGRRYLVFFNKSIAEIIDRTPPPWPNPCGSWKMLGWLKRN